MLRLISNTMMKNSPPIPNILSIGSVYKCIQFVYICRQTYTNVCATAQSLYCSVFYPSTLVDACHTNVDSKFCSKFTRKEAASRGSWLQHWVLRNHRFCSFSCVRCSPLNGQSAMLNPCTTWLVCFYYYGLLVFSGKLLRLRFSASW
jgi:hypothetical protein